MVLGYKDYFYYYLFPKQHCFWHIHLGIVKAGRTPIHFTSEYCSPFPTGSKNHIAEKCKINISLFVLAIKLFPFNEVHAFLNMPFSIILCKTMYHSGNLLAKKQISLIAFFFHHKQIQFQQHKNNISHVAKCSCLFRYSFEMPIGNNLFILSTPAINVVSRINSKNKKNRVFFSKMKKL